MIWQIENESSCLRRRWGKGDGTTATVWNAEVRQ